MRNLVIQFFDKDLPKWADISSRLFNSYSKAVGCEYIVDTKKEYAKVSPYFEHLKLIYDPAFEQYDRILYVDMDVIPETHQNIFLENIQDVGVVAERNYPHMTTVAGFTTKENQKAYGSALSQFKLEGIKEAENYIIFNSGVILWSKEGRMKARKSFMPWDQWFNGIKQPQMKLDQPFFNSQLNKLDYTELPLKWNCYPRVRFEKGHFPSDANFLHYTNKKKQSIEEIY
jgi:lipopolysaccharide biosynthesis glycosyltransferase